jgi:hypothetical protein
LPASGGVLAFLTLRGRVPGDNRGTPSVERMNAAMVHPLTPPDERELAAIAQELDLAFLVTGPRVDVRILKSLKRQARAKDRPDLITRLQALEAKYQSSSATLVSTSSSNFPPHTPAPATAPIGTHDAPVSPRTHLDPDLPALNSPLLELQKTGREGKPNNAQGEQLGQRVNDVQQAYQQRPAQTGQELSAQRELASSRLSHVFPVPSSSLQRLEEYHADQKIAFSVSSLLLGIVLGIGMNVLSEDQGILTEGVSVVSVLLLVLALMSGMSFVWGLRLRARANVLKRELLSESVPRPTDSNRAYIRPPND